MRLLFFNFKANFMSIDNMFIEEIIEAPFLSREEAIVLIERKHPEQWWGDCYDFKINGDFLEITYNDMDENHEGEMYFTGFTKSLSPIPIY